jgi:hypothetical protein
MARPYWDLEGISEGLENDHRFLKQLLRSAKDASALARRSAELIEESNDLLAWADRLLKARIPQA